MTGYMFSLYIKIHVPVSRGFLASGRAGLLCLARLAPAYVFRAVLPTYTAHAPKPARLVPLSVLRVILLSYAH